MTTRPTIPARLPRTLAALRADPRIASIWQEDDGCFDGHRLSYWADLAPGFRWEDCSSLHEPTVADLRSALSSVYVACADCGAEETPFGGATNALDDNARCAACASELVGREVADCNFADALDQAHVYETETAALDAYLDNALDTVSGDMVARAACVARFASLSVDRTFALAAASVVAAEIVEHVDAYEPPTSACSACGDSTLDGHLDAEGRCEDCAADEPEPPTTSPTLTDVQRAIPGSRTESPGRAGTVVVVPLGSDRLARISQGTFGLGIFDVGIYEGDADAADTILGADTVAEVVDLLAAFGARCAAFDASWS